ncbi:hypothetical protein C4561_04075 [candidate division WWE3 bacterium]|jgi:hypothetical protein|uniref:Uncharacterized protein n=1 Tax=candidate division WWE3 bacterium TaxID=2053526 RepID=A0A3A4ZJA1_UNCKA|nr:MAG: hypothetical protein C4561_04075 [candidate division WWE3 bacterium]
MDADSVEMDVLEVQRLTILYQKDMGAPDVIPIDTTTHLVRWKGLARLIIENNQVVDQSLTGRGSIRVIDSDGKTIVEQESTGTGSGSQTISATKGSVIKGVKQTRN